MTTAHLTTWPLDGVEIDLTRMQTTVAGDLWKFTGATTETGEPLMASGDTGPYPLSEVYWTFGPLVAAPRPRTQDDVHAWLMACPAGAADEESATPTPRTFAVLLGRLRRRAS